MRQTLVYRLSPVLMVLAAMAGYVAWEAAMHATGASSAMEWTIAAGLALGGIVWATPQILRYWPQPVGFGSLPFAPVRFGHAASDLRRPLLLAKSGWRFGNPLKEAVEPDVERFMPMVRPELERALVDILEHPLAIRPTVEPGSDPARIKHIHPSMVGKKEAPTLLLAYTAKPREQVIPQLALSRAVAAAPGLVATDDELTTAALERLMETVQARLDGGTGHSLAIEN